MQARRITGSRLLAVTAVAGLGVLVAGPTASARVRIPEKPKVASVKRVAALSTARAQSQSREIVSLGHDSYSGLELFVVKVDGQVVGIPFG